MANRNLPRIIIAPDLSTPREIADLMSEFEGIGPEHLGLKDPDHLNQDQQLIEQFVATDRYVILETRLDNTLAKMSIAARSFLRHNVLPSAITVSPSQQTVDGDKFKRSITDLAEEKGVDVIGYANRGHLASDDDGLVNRQVVGYGLAAAAGFKAYEVFGKTAKSEEFARARATQAGDSPLVIVSKFIEPGASDDETAQKAIELLRDEVAHAVYLGESITTAQNPGQLIDDILSGIAI